MFVSVLRAPQVTRVPAFDQPGRLRLAVLLCALVVLRHCRAQVRRRQGPTPATVALLLVARESLSLARAGVPMAVVTPPAVAGFTSPVAGPPVDPAQGGRSGRLAIGPAGRRPSA